MNLPRPYKLSDEQWAKIESLLFGRNSSCGRPAFDNRQALQSLSIRFISLPMATAL
jgi:hypothetical protein